MSQRTAAGRYSPQRERQAASAIREEKGIALVITLIVLTVISMLGLYMALGATTETKLSDNYESRLRANYAAMAGLSHTREILRGLEFDDQLNGPAGDITRPAAYVTSARTYAFRNPTTWTLARALNLVNPATDVAGIPTEGLINTGALPAAAGTVLIPLTGITFTISNPAGPGTVVSARYMVKITDNSGEASELAGDPADDPFHDGDNIIIARSLGVAAILRDDSGGVVRRNAVAMYESRLKRRMTFDLDAPFVVEGNQVEPSSPQMFDGNAFGIRGGASNLGIATIDTDTSDGIQPTQQISSQLAVNQRDNISGMGLTPSISDITAAVAADEDKRLLRDQNYLWNFVHNVVPGSADSTFSGNQHWSGGNAPDLGFVDITLPDNDPSQRPRMTYVDGDLDIGGNLDGGGVLVITGKLGGNGSLTFNGLILVIGAGEVDASGLNIGFNGGMFVAKVVNSGGTITFGTPKFSWRGNSNLNINSQAIHMGLNLFPAAQLSWREITGIIDPN